MLAVAGRVGKALSSELLEVNYDELGQLERGKADNNVHGSAVEISLSCGRCVAFHQAGIASLSALEGALAGKPPHERFDIKAYLDP